jgi:hypothetical protein
MNPIPTSEKVALALLGLSVVLFLAAAIAVCWDK